MKFSFSTGVVLAFVLLGVGQDAFAWGPATHIGLGGSLLDQIGLLPAGVAAILARHSLAYLYGNIAADVVFAKRLSRVKQFCHHWSTAFRLLEGAADDRSKSFAYGYLSHLAADTVAHGKFVPRQILVSDSSMGFGHFYWELRADALEPEPTWSTLEFVIRDEHADHHDRLQIHLTDTFLSYELNRLLFDRMNALAVRQGFRRTMNFWTRVSRRPLSGEMLAAYHGASVDRMMSVLTDGSRSSVLRDDPNGTSALMRASVDRKDRRRRKRRGLPIDARLLESAAGLSPVPRPFTRITGSRDFTDSAVQ